MTPRFGRNFFLDWLDFGKQHRQHRCNNNTNPLPLLHPLPNARPPLLATPHLSRIAETTAAYGCIDSCSSALADASSRNEAITLFRETYDKLAVNSKTTAEEATKAWICLQGAYRTELKTQLMANISF
jgi:hypothetical protein